MTTRSCGERSLSGPRHRIRGAHRAGWPCWLLLGSLACGRDPVEECTALLEAGKHEAAAARCEAAFDDTADLRAGTAAAKAQKELGRDDDVLRWVDRLRGTPAEADVLHLAKRIHWRHGEADLAAATGRRELALRRQAGDHGGAADSSYSLFFYAWSAADHREALQRASESFEDAVRAEDRKRKARALQALQTVLYEVGDLERARGVLEAVAALVEPEERADRARLLVYEGLLRLHGGRPALAGDAFEQAIELGADSVDRAFLRSTHLNLTKTYLALGDVDRAEQHLEAAWQHADPTDRQPSALLYYKARILGARRRYAEAAALLATALEQAPDPAWTRDLQHQKGVVEEARGDLRSAEVAYRRSIETVEGMRASLGPDELKSWLLDEQRRPFEGLFRLQARSGRAKAALDTMERAKARTFLDAFVNAAAEPTGETGEPAIALAASQRLETLEALLPPMSGSPVVALRPIDEALRAVAGRHLLLYFMAGDELWMIEAADLRLRVHRLATSTAAVGDLVRRFVARPDDLGLAALLGEILLPAGAIAEPRPGATLHVVTDGVLGDLPFSALRRRDRYLVEDHAVAYVPSVNVLAAIDTQPRNGTGPAVVLADPRGDLPAAAVEAQEVAAGLGVAPRLAAAATFEQLRRASRADVLHLATHSGLGPRGPWLKLADGDVAAHRVVNGRIAPRLVVLASCASAARRGRGMWGSLGAAFMVAGSETVLASLWSVEDQAARQVVSRFYENGGAGDPVGALARAQRALIVEGKAPSFWAPFVVFGSTPPHGEAE